MVSKPSSEIRYCRCPDTTESRERFLQLDATTHKSSSFRIGKSSCSDNNPLHRWNTLENRGNFGDSWNTCRCLISGRKSTARVLAVKYARTVSPCYHNIQSVDGNLRCVQYSGKTASIHFLQTKHIDKTFRLSSSSPATRCKSSGGRSLDIFGRILHVSDGESVRHINNCLCAVLPLHESWIPFKYNSCITIF
jgi:hypothetical protein